MRKIIAVGVLCLHLMLSQNAAAAEHSFAPVVGYSPIWSLALGGGYFFKTDSTSGRVIAVYTLANCFQFQPRLEVKLTDWFQWDTDSTIQKGFEPYFGEGPQTQVGARRDVRSFRSESYTGIRFYPAEQFSFSPKIGMRTFHAIDSEPNPWNGTKKRLVSPTLGFSVRWELRDKEEDYPDVGFFHESTAWLSPPDWSEAVDNPFLTVEGRFTYGFKLFSDVRLVMTAYGGGTIGESDYLYRFKLGGSTLLRGYVDNRFRGKFFYLQAAEVRVPLTEMFSLAAFSEVGEATDTLTEFHPKYSFGGGLRIGLPPDYVQSARIDVGFGQDSWALYADFGLPF